MNEQTPFEHRTRELLDESTAKLDGHTLSKLTQARHAALAQGRRPARAWWHIALPAGATAAAVLAFVALNRPPAPADNGFDDVELIADAPEVVDDGEELEFYEWAAGEMES
jgi:hypothetical protein